MSSSHTNEDGIGAIGKRLANDVDRRSCGTSEYEYSGMAIPFPGFS